jgi:hypothetical protein
MEKGVEGAVSAKNSFESFLSAAYCPVADTPLGEAKLHVQSERNEKEAKQQVSNQPTNPLM